ncbi:MFS transporter [Nonomuraea spiralis]|uniref:MFS transporter n=1 Tax=Nonomuraea spiralis TaxID=46182 RepID=A0ABV5IZH9_9ACTN|nr:MFS transporter [Nonomuraea spiralis]GGT22435.1 MFS transporter [Nonomuraea spiralis]
MHTPGTAHPRRWWILAALCLSLLVLVIDNTILNLAIPSLMSELGASPQDIQWIISSYTLAFAGLLLTAGALADRYGRKRMLIIGLSVFAVASLLASMTTAPGVLVAARALMGVGGSLVMPTTMSILVTVFDAEERRKAIAAWSTVSLTGILIGPSLGGFLLDHFWWGSVFLVNVPVAAVAIAAAAWLMPESTGAAGRTDVVGAVLCTVGMVAVVYAITAASEHGWGGLVPTGVLVSGLVVMAAFVVWELRTPAPMLPLRIFRDRNFTGGTFSVMLLAFAAAGMMLALTQYVQLVVGYGVLRAGLALLPFAAASAAFNMAGATLGRRFSNRAMVTTGMLITAAGFALLWSLTPGSGYPLLGAALVVMGMGAGLATPAAVTALMGAIPPEEAGAGSAMNSTISQAGSALGVAVLGSALTAGYLSRLPAQAPAAVRESLAGAVAVGDPQLLAAARAAFTGSMSVGMAIGAALSTAAAVLAFSLLRAKPAAVQVAEPASVRTRETI